MERHEMSMTEGVKNAVTLAFIEGLSDRINEKSKELIEELEEIEEIKKTDAGPFEIPMEDRGISVFSIYTMGLSYIESCSVLLLHDTVHREVEPECTQLLEYARGDQQYSRYADGGDRKEELEELLEFIYSDRASMNDYSRLLGRTDVLNDDIIEQINNVQDIRGQFIHNPQSIANLRTSDDVIEAVQECLEVVNQIGSVTRERIDLNELYHDLTDYRHQDLI